MRYIIICSIFCIITCGCTVKVAREAGKAIKSVETSLQKTELDQVKKTDEKKITKQIQLSKINLIGKSQDQIISILGTPNFVRNDGDVISMRFDRKNCITYAFFNGMVSKPRVEYFELRSKTGRLLTRKSNIDSCFFEIAKS